LRAVLVSYQDWYQGFVVCVPGGLVPGVPEVQAFCVLSLHSIREPPSGCFGKVDVTAIDPHGCTEDIFWIDIKLRDEVLPDSLLETAAFGFGTGYCDSWFGCFLVELREDPMGFSHSW